MKRLRMYEHTEDRRRNDRPVIGIFQKKFYHRGLIQIDMGWNGGAEPVIMPVIVLESPGKVEFSGGIQLLRGDRRIRNRKIRPADKDHVLAEDREELEILSVKVPMDKADIIAVVGDALVDDMGLAGGDL